MDREGEEIMTALGIIIPILLLLIIGFGIYTVKSKNKSGQNNKKGETKTSGPWMWISIILSVIIIGIIFLSGESNNPQQPSQAEKPTVWTANPTQIEAPDSAWTAFYPVPSGHFGIAVQKGESAEIIFSDNKYYLLDNYKQIEFGKTSGKFKFRGIGKKVVIYIYQTE